MSALPAVGRKYRRFIPCAVSCSVPRNAVRYRIRIVPPPIPKPVTIPLAAPVRALRKNSIYASGFARIYPIGCLQSGHISYAFSEEYS